MAALCSPKISLHQPLLKLVKGALHGTLCTLLADGGLLDCDSRQRQNLRRDRPLRPLGNLKQVSYFSEALLLLLVTGMRRCPSSWPG